MSIYILTSDGELYHHGIKGMRWGIRRFQKKDGSLTAAGKKRYDDSPTMPKKSKHRIKVEEAYMKAGLSKKQAEAAADKRIKTEKILAASAGVAVTACAAYAANKVLKNRIDGVIKASDSLQRIEMKDTGSKLHDVFYISKGKHDNKRYYNMLGSTRQMQTGEAYLMKLKADGNVKVASRHNAEKTFRELYNSDMEFKLRVSQQANVHFAGKNKVDPGKLLKGKDRNEEISKLYENFNSNLIGIRSTNSGADKKFYSALKKKGYGAVQDINDMKFSGYNAKNPLIVFDNSNKNIMAKSVKKIDKNLMMAGHDEYMKARREADRASKIKDAFEIYGPITATTLSATTLAAYTSDPSKDDISTGRR